MASSSSSSSRWSYDVFLSFRGEDTRKTFTSHLYEVLNDRGIKTFQDDKRLEYGATIPEELCKAIEESQFAIVIFSKNYATSRWCLNELVEIMECKTQFRQTVIPIFYDVDPSHVRNQKESFAKAFEEHEIKYKDYVEGIQRWRIALNAAANLKGSCDNHEKTDADCIRQIVDQISSKLCKISLSYLQNIVGIDTHLEEIESLLEIGINDVRIMGIWGMGGVGKTTIARAMFDTLLVRRDRSYQFDGACFLEDIKENKGRIHSLQNTLLSKLLREKAEYNNKEEGKHQMASRLCSKKVLIVLDDIDDKDHYLEYLAGDLDWFGKGSRVVVTTRNKHLIGKNDAIYEVTALPNHESIQLFYQHAFRKEDPDECFKELSLEVVNYAKGLPLALKVWGSLLHNLGLTEWKSAIEHMKINSNSKIVEKLKISYDGLEPIQQKMFLDIACFFRGRYKGYAMQILESCHSGVEYGLRVLIDKSLVSISEKGEIQMHDFIEDMGKYIVNFQKDPEERSRLWLVEDFEEVMINNTHLPSLRRIDLSFSKSLMRTPDFTGMPNLEYLNLKNCSNLEEVHHSLGCCSKLIRLNLMYCESLKRFPCVNMESLKYLSVGNCSRLEKFPEILGRIKPELEIGIRELPSSYFQYKSHITELDLSYMKNLVALPSSICRLKSLVSLNVSGCLKLESLPEEMGDLDNLEELDASYTLISRPPSTIVRLNKLKILKFGVRDGVHFEFLPVLAEGLRSLVHLNLSDCNLIDGGLPEDIGSLSSLKELYLNGNNFEHLPRSIAQLGDLRILHLRDCKRLTQLPQLPPELNELHVDCHTAMRSIHDLVTKRKKLQCVIFESFDYEDDAHNDFIYNLFAHALFQDISSLRHHISASDSLSENVFTIVHPKKKIPSWFHHQGWDSSVSVNLPENWYIPDKFLGFSVCYNGSLIDTTAQLIPVCDDGMSCIIHKLDLSNHSECDTESSGSSKRDTEFAIHFLLVPLAVLWDTSEANGKTPNDYGIIRLSFTGEMNKYGVRLLYKEEPEDEALSQMRENNYEPTEHSTGIRRTRYKNSVHHDSVTDESSCCCRIL
ncbi:PREDICTED: TMV resistance protein N-like [Nicotiana attenuata]|uniref:ADP-ribosyl cyclase/cyclic ADP-ribose hydrolase n=1 Tax=Nicotiana attenuata TaxID=49451 RepID=A0A1J6KSF3_NICAT|nr:PREDICTED: TMV resistance protein N-like [Nicotiana attenuata]OIT27720.1 tmv resistance protein n [Nicotiana attenuata]